MKRNGLLVVMIFLSIHLFGQIGKGDVFISVDGNFNKSASTNGVTTNEFGTKGKYLELGPSIEYVFTDRLAVGVGLDYQWSKETRSSEIFLRFPDINFLHFQEMNTKSQVLLPNVFLKYYIPITNKLYFNTNLKFSYGKPKSEYKTDIIDANYFSGDALALSKDYPTFMYGDSKKYEMGLFSTHLGPELSYFITPGFCGYLSLGGVEYSIIDWKGDDTLWTANFNPVNWKLGFKFKL